MTATNHALTGAAIASVIQQPWLALPLAFVSHFACDALPHFGLKAKNFFGSQIMYLYLAAEAIVLAGLVIFLLSQPLSQPILLASCAFLAMSPDLAWLYYGVKGRHGQPASYDWLSRWHARIQWSETSWGIIVEVGWAGLMLTVMLSR